MRARRIAGLFAALAVLGSACAGGGNGNTRTILVDFSHDEFASFFLFNFPEKVTVHQGTELVFRQTWTGEPHTVTGGSLVSEKLEEGKNWITWFEAFEALAGAGVPLPNPDDPGDATFADFAQAVEEAPESEDRTQFIEGWNALRAAGAPLPDLDERPDMSFEELVSIVDAQIEPVFEGLPWALGEDDDDGITQNAGQPCYLSDGLPPEEPDEPCRDDDQEQPAFDGTHTYYNSGIIPFEGPRGNTYRVPLAEDIAPGRYMFYCAVHGFGQTTEVEVVPAGTDVPSADDVARAAREEIDEAAEPLVDLFRQATSEGAIDVDGERIEGPFAGVDAPFLEHTGINEFVPRERTVKAGEPITWKMMGADHTISFNVPRYFPIMEFLDDGTVRTNPMLDPPAGGAPEPPEQEGDGPLEIDGGTWDGEGFWSSGLMAAQPFIEYTLRISEPGTYEYACLLHPPMVGTLEVTA